MGTGPNNERRGITVETVRQSLKLLPTEKAWDLVPLAVGYENIVLHKPADTVVYKVNNKELFEAALTKLAGKSIEEQQNKRLDEYTRKVENELELMEAFGKEHVVPHRIKKVTFPFTPKALMPMANAAHARELERYSAEEAYTVDLFVEVQEYSDYVANLKKHDKDGSSEGFYFTIIKPEKIKSANTPADLALAVDEQVAGVAPELGECGISIDKLLAAGFENEVKEFVSKAIDYTKKTGKQLDIYGPGNVVFFRDENGKASYQLYDAVFPDANASDEKMNLPRGNFERILFAYNYRYIKAMNTFAERLGLNERLAPEDLSYFKESGVPTEWKNPWVDIYPKAALPDSGLRQTGPNFGESAGSVP
jgi:hypothetical protein